MTKYLELHESINPKIVGIKDGLGQADIGEDFFAKNLWYEQLFSPEYFTVDRWTKWAKMPDYGNNLLEIPLFNSAKVTDFVDFVGFMRGYIINDKLRSILQAFNLPRHQYFEASFKRRDKIISGYWWLVYDLDDGYETVNFQKSKFNFSWHERTYQKQFEISTYQEYISLVYNYERAAPATELYFNKNFNYDLDLWGGGANFFRCARDIYLTGFYLLSKSMASPDMKQGSRNANCFLSR